MKKKFESWLCKKLGHKWNIVPTNDYHSKTWRCSRCGETQVISDKRY